MRRLHSAVPLWVLALSRPGAGHRQTPLSSSSVSAPRSHIAVQRKPSPSRRPRAGRPALPRLPAQRLPVAAPCLARAIFPSQDLAHKRVCVVASGARGPCGCLPPASPPDAAGPQALVPVRSRRPISDSSGLSAVSLERTQFRPALPRSRSGRAAATDLVCGGNEPSTGLSPAASRAAAQNSPQSRQAERPRPGPSSCSPHLTCRTHPLSRASRADAPRPLPLSVPTASVLSWASTRPSWGVTSKLLLCAGGPSVGS